MSDPAGPRVAFVLGGGGVLGATQVGMLRALLEVGQTPDLVLGTSVGALNGAVLAGRPSLAVVDQLTTLWTSMSTSGVFGESLVGRVRTLVQHGTHLHSSAPLRQVLEQQLPVKRIEELAVPFQCVAASIERATAHWFTSGSITDAVLASCAVPGLFPPVRIGDETFIDGGIVDSVPVGRAVQLGATEVYVLHVGRIERQLTAPQRPWEVGMVAFEIARRHRFVEDMAKLPDGVKVHLLPSGSDKTPLVSVRYRKTGGVADRIERGYEATRAFLNGGTSPE